MSRRKPLAALAAITVALAPAVPAATASAATPARAAHTASIGLGGGGRLVPGSPPCLFLIRQVQLALLFHNTPAANFWATVFVYAGCGGAAI